MPFKKTISYDNDIKALLKSRARGTSFHKQEVKRLSEKYNVPVRTVYHNESLLKSRHSVLHRKRRSDRGQIKKVTGKHIKLIKELREGGRSMKESVGIIQKKFKIKISHHTQNKISKNMRSINIADNNNSEFGDNIRNFLNEFLELKLIAPHKGINLKFNDVEFLLEKPEVEDIILVLTNAYNKYSGINTKLKLNRMGLVKMRLYHLLEALIQEAKTNLDTKEVESIIRQYMMLKKKDTKSPVNYKIFEKCMKELKPDITFDEIYSLIKKYSPSEDE